MRKITNKIYLTLGVMLHVLGSSQALADDYFPSMYSGYTSTFSDAITGSNRSANNHWYVTPNSAGQIVDRHRADIYERPIVSNMQMDNGQVVTQGTDPAYYGYVDITQGHYGHSGDYMYFGIEVYDQYNYSSSGPNLDSQLGEGTYYRIRFNSLSSDELLEDPLYEAAGGLMLSSEAESDLGKDGSPYKNWQTSKSMAYLDINSDVGKPGDSLNGYETKVISDGEGDNGDKKKGGILKVRRAVNPDTDRYVIEFKFNYKKFNRLFPDYELSPETLQYLVFESNRGAKDNGNYQWRFTESGSVGSPYEVTGMNNVVELDTLYGSFHDAPAVPEPGTMLLLGSALGGAAFLRRRKAKKLQNGEAKA